MRGLNFLDWLALVILIIGALNFGVLGASGLNLIANGLGVWPHATNIAYVVLGLAALYTIGVAHAFRRAPLFSEISTPRTVDTVRGPRTVDTLTGPRTAETVNGPVACPPCPPCP